MPGIEGESVTPVAAAAIRMAVDAIRDLHGDRLAFVLLFGSRSRSEARPDSDCDLAVVLRPPVDRPTERRALSDATYEAVVETSVEVHALALSVDEWASPELHPNPALVEAIRRDGILLWASDWGVSLGPDPAWLN